MIYMAIPLGTTAKQVDDALYPNWSEEAKHKYTLDSMVSDDQAAVADWAQARALQTRTDYQVFRLVETLYYKGGKR